jgi:F-type H+-transporting ATPase subunit delta
MAETKLARRYAKSLLDLGREQNITDALYSDMNLLLDTFKKNRQLSVVFKSPIVTTDKKDAILNDLFSDKVNKLTLEFFRIVTRKNREYFIEDIAKSFVEIYKTFKGMQSARVITATPVDDKLRKQIMDVIAATTSDKIDLEEVVDKSIIGGFILRWGDRQIDASVTSKLHSLRKDFRDNLYIKDY